MWSLCGASFLGSQGDAQCIGTGKRDGFRERLRGGKPTEDYILASGDLASNSRVHWSHDSLNPPLIPAPLGWTATVASVKPHDAAAAGKAVASRQKGTVACHRCILKTIRKKKDSNELGGDVGGARRSW